MPIELVCRGLELEIKHSFGHSTGPPYLFVRALFGDAKSIPHLYVTERVVRRKASSTWGPDTNEYPDAPNEKVVHHERA